jgi:hypothetical protein
LQGAQLADGLVPEVVLPEPLQRLSIDRDPQSRWLFADRTKAISGRQREIVYSPAGPVLRDGDRTEMGPYVVVVSGPPMPPRLHEAVRLTEILRVAPRLKTAVWSRPRSAWPCRPCREPRRRPAGPRG